MSNEVRIRGGLDERRYRPMHQCLSYYLTERILIIELV
ncbi:MAG: hypothetical protein K0S04_3773 [Herbinix sp.]|jgi:hypothetical protein|nr:hypothetical protein [Herbinix sp.]